MIYHSQYEGQAQKRLPDLSEAKVGGMEHETRNIITTLTFLCLSSVMEKVLDVANVHFQDSDVMDTQQTGLLCPKPLRCQDGKKAKH